MADTKARAVVEIVDRTGPGLRKVNANLKRLTGQMQRVGRASAGLAKAGANLRRLGAAAGDAAARIRSSIARAFARARDAAHRAIAGIRSALGGLGRAMKLGFAAGAAGAAAAGFGIWKLGKAVIETGQTFEMLKVRLEALEGGSKQAEKALAWIEDFAAKTPLELEDVVEAYANLKAMGIDPTNGSLRALVDTMAMQGLTADGLQGIILSLGQAYAQGKLQGDTFREMATRGIPAAKLLAKALGKTEKQIYAMASAGKLGRNEIALLVAMMGKRAAGASEKMSRTLVGIKSNINDLWTTFKKKIAQAGIFESVKKKLDEVRAAMERMKESGKMDEWAKRISKIMETVADAVWNAGKAILNADLDKVEAWLKRTIDSLGKITADDVKAAFESVKQTLKDISTIVRDVADAIETLKNAAKAVKDFFGGGGGGKTAKSPLDRAQEDAFKRSLKAKYSPSIDALAAITGKQIPTRFAKGPVKPGFDLDSVLQRGGQQAAAEMERRGPSIGEQISQAMARRAALIGGTIGDIFAQRAMRVLNSMTVRVDGVPQGVYGPRRNGTVVRRVAPPQAPVGTDAPAPLASQ